MANRAKEQGDVDERLAHARWVLRMQVVTSMGLARARTVPVVVTMEAPFGTKAQLREAYKQAKALVGSGKLRYAAALDRFSLRSKRDRLGARLAEEGVEA